MEEIPNKRMTKWRKSLPKDRMNSAPKYRQSGGLRA